MARAVLVAVVAALVAWRVGIAITQHVHAPPPNAIPPSHSPFAHFFLLLKTPWRRCVPQPKCECCQQEIVAPKQYPFDRLSRWSVVGEGEWASMAGQRGLWEWTPRSDGVSRVRHAAYGAWPVLTELQWHVTVALPAMLALALFQRLAL